MRVVDTFPEHFPGKELSLKWGNGEFAEYIYEINYVDYGSTTSGQLLAIPDIWYRTLGEFDGRYLDSGAGKIGSALLTEGQRKAFAIAANIEKQRKNGDPEKNTFAGIREVRRDKKGLLYVTTTEEGSMLQDAEPFAAVANAQIVGFADFATSVRGYYGFFKYDKADVEAFIPEALVGQANAYMMIDEPRVVVGSDSDHEFQIARLMFLDITTDMDYPVDQIDTSTQL